MELVHAEQIAWAAMQQHGLVAKGWDFDFHYKRIAFGTCWFHKRLITLNVNITLLNDVPTVTDTILHEIAHALAGHSAGHGPKWKEACNKIGAKPQRCFDPEVDRVAMPEMKYIGLCPLGHKHPTNRMPRKGRRYSCNFCYKGFNDQFLITYKLNPNYEK